MTETYHVVYGIPLRFAVDPAAIREHYGDNARVQDMEDADLELIGERVLSDDWFYGAFNDALSAAFSEMSGFDPDLEEEEDDEDGEEEATDGLHAIP